MGEIDQEDEAKEDKDAGTNEGHIVAVENEESCRDKEGGNDKKHPHDDFWTPPSKMIQEKKKVSLDLVRAVSFLFFFMQEKMRYATYPFWMAALLDRESLTPISRMPRIKWNKARANPTR